MARSAASATLWSIRIREQRKRFGLSQREFATALDSLAWTRAGRPDRWEPLGVDQPMVSDWERARHRPDAFYQELICALFGATAHELGFRARLPWEVEPEGVPDGLLDAVVGVAAAIEHGDRGGRLGRADVSRLEAVTTLYRSLDYERGGGSLYQEVGRFAESASALVSRACSDQLMPRLLPAAAEARQLAGWTAFDAGSHSDAQRHWLSAERAAIAGGCTQLAARVRYCQARQFQHLRHNRDALETLRLARAQLAGGSTPALNAMIDGAEASSLAAIGQRRAALATLDRARSEFERIEPEREPGWMRFYDAGELLAQYGRVYRDLARADRRHGTSAVRWVADAISAFGLQNVRSRVLNEIGLCSALFLADAPDEAVDAGARVIEHARQVASARVVDRLRGIQRDLAAHDDDSTVADFARTIQTIASP